MTSPRARGGFGAPGFSQTRVSFVAERFPGTKRGEGERLLGAATSPILTWQAPSLMLKRSMSQPNPQPD